VLVCVRVICICIANVIVRVTGSCRVIYIRVMCSVSCIVNGIAIAICMFVFVSVTVIVVCVVL